MFALGVTDPTTLWDIGDAEKMWYPGAELTGSDPTTGTWTYPIRDHLGTPRATYGQTRNLLSKNEYSPYGIPELQLGQPSPLGYTGHYHDTETGLNYAPYRYYDPHTTRWLKRDPLGMIDGPNMYAYVKGNPVNRYDKMGLRITDVIPGYDSYTPFPPQKTACNVWIGVRAVDIFPVNLFYPIFGASVGHWEITFGKNPDEYSQHLPTKKSESGKLRYGSGAGKDCCEAKCSEIISCLRSTQTAQLGGLRPCQTATKKHLGKCCLQK